MQLDFNKYTISQILLTREFFKEDWQQSIFDFLEEWNNNVTILVQTSGSTGNPKSITLSKLSMIKSAQLTGLFFNLQPSNTALLCLPVHYIAGKMMLVRAIVLQLNIICVEPSTNLKNINKPIDFVAMTPMQVENSWGILTHFKTLIVGGAPILNNLKQKIIQDELNVYETYGMTETITHIALKKIDTLNENQPFTIFPSIKINQNNKGCLVIKTPYFEDVVETNDVVELLNDNQFIWKGRADNVINSGGVKLFPEVIENKIKPFITQEFIISSLPDDLLGEKLVLIIEGDSYDFSLPENVLTKFETPKKVLFVTKFPRTKSGKIKRNLIQVN